MALKVFIFLFLLMALLISTAVEGAAKPSPDDPNKKVDECEMEDITPRKRNICNANDLLLSSQRSKYKRVMKLLKAPETNYLITYKEVSGMRRGYTAMLWAAENNNTKIFKLLLDAGSEVNHESDSGVTSLYLLAEQGNLECVKLLLEGKNANPNIKTAFGFTALLVATWNKHPLVVKSLLDNGANPNATTPESQYFALYFAAKNGDIESLKYILAANANVSITTSWGVSALHAATYWGFKDIAMELLRAGADPDLKEQHGYSSVLKAVYYNHPDILDEYLKAGADVNSQCNAGYTALMFASMRGYISMANNLIAANADVNLQDKMGKTALHWATRNRRTEIIKILLKACADLTIKDKKGKTALVIANRRGPPSIASLLEGHNADTCS